MHLKFFTKTVLSINIIKQLSKDDYENPSCGSKHRNLITIFLFPETYVPNGLSHYVKIFNTEIFFFKSYTPVEQTRSNSKEGCKFDALFICHHGKE